MRLRTDTLANASKVIAAGTALILFYTNFQSAVLHPSLRHPAVYVALAFGTTYSATTDLKATLAAFLIAALALDLHRGDEENDAEEEQAP